jgi:hypothetical protein
MLMGPDGITVPGLARREGCLEERQSAVVNAVTSAPEHRQAVRFRFR